MDYKVITRQEAVAEINKCNLKNESPLPVIQQFLWSLGYNDLVDAINKIIKKINTNEEMSYGNQGSS